jgi:hypothetical protein
MDMREVVRVLRSYMSDEGVTLRREYGPQAVTAAEEMRELLNYRLQEEDVTNLQSLWQDFQTDPGSADAELAGALETLVEADPAMKRRLEEHLVDYRRVLAHPRASRGGSGQGTVAADFTGPIDGDEEQIRDLAHDEMGDGAYLYGNVRPGVETNDPNVGDGILEAGEDAQVITLGIDAEDLPLFFDRLSARIADHPELTPVEKNEVRAELQSLQNEVARGDGADVTRLVDEIRSIQETAPDIGAILLERLRDVAPYIGPVQTAVDVLS